MLEFSQNYFSVSEVVIKQMQNILLLWRQTAKITESNFEIELEEALKDHLLYLQIFTFEHLNQDVYKVPCLNKD